MELNSDEETGDFALSYSSLDFEENDTTTLKGVQPFMCKPEATGSSSLHVSEEETDDSRLNNTN